MWKFRFAGILAIAFYAQPSISGEMFKGEALSKYDWLDAAPRELNIGHPERHATRAFEVDLEGRGAARDSVFLRRPQAEIVTCFGDGECKTFGAPGILDLIPARSGKLALVFQSQTQLCSVSANRSSLECALSVTKATGRSAETDCPVDGEGSMRCTSSRRFAMGSQILGQFEVEGQPTLIQLTPYARSCSIGPDQVLSCIAQPALASIPHPQSWTVARLTPLGPNAVISFGAGTTSVCMKPVGGSEFACRTAAGAIIGQPWVTAAFIGGRLGESLAVVSQTAAREAQEGAVVAKLLYRELVAELGIPDQPSEKLYFIDGQTLPPYDIVPEYFMFDWSGGVDHTYWTDDYNYWFWDRTAPKPGSCYSVCDAERSQDRYVCPTMGVTAALTCGVSTGLIVSSGATPIFGVVAGTVAGTICGDMATGACYAVADNLRQRCYLKCDSL